MTGKIILFDGVCNFCNFWVKFVCKHDAKKIIKFASLQSEMAQQLIKQNNILTNDLSSVIFINENEIFLQSSAALTICKYLDGGWKLFYALIFIPKPLRDMMYNFIAKNRYKWFGKNEKCVLPTDDIKERFL